MPLPGNAPLQFVTPVDGYKIPPSLSLTDVQETTDGDVKRPRWVSTCSAATLEYITCQSVQPDWLLKLFSELDFNCLHKIGEGGHGRRRRIRENVYRLTGPCFLGSIFFCRTGYPVNRLTVNIPSFEQVWSNEIQPLLTYTPMLDLPSMHTCVILSFDLLASGSVRANGWLQTISLSSCLCLAL